MEAGFSLKRYKLLGRSGLRVSPLALGTMTFGTQWGWGSDPDEARRIFSTYIERGGNFIDTANQYTDGASEELIGKFAKGLRDQLVIATKYTLTSDANNPNSGGNHRKSMRLSVEASLRRLATDHIDLLYLHAWDFTTSSEEILRAMDDLVRCGKVLYVGISNTPAWQVARMQVISDLRGWSPLVALQVRYNLTDRAAERDLLPMADELGLGVAPWSPLAEGILAGKYTIKNLGHEHFETSQESLRKEVLLKDGSLTERILGISVVVGEVAREMEKSAAQVALAWTLLDPRITSPIIGARTLEQLEDNLGSLEVEFTPSQRQKLDSASAIELGYPHDYLRSLMESSYMGIATRISPFPR